MLFTCWIQYDKWVGAQGGYGLAWLGTSVVVLLVVMWSLVFGNALATQPADAAPDLSRNTL